MEYKVAPISKDELLDADEIFYCGSASEVTPIRQIDNNIINNGKAGELTLKLQKKYYNVVRGKHEQYHDWLTFIN